MKSQGSGQITVRDINGSPGALTYAQLEGRYQGKQWPCPFQHGLERLWSDQGVPSNFLSVPMEGFGKGSGMNMTCYVQGQRENGFGWSKEAVMGSKAGLVCI